MMQKIIPLLWLAVLLAPSAAIADFAGKQDSSAPIEIAANAFEVLQKENKAIFTGDVVAVQGKMTLKSDRMTVHYRSGAEAKGSAGAISRIDVDGHVWLISAQETANGARGVYYVDKKIMTLDGDVVLTKDKNVLKGQSLEYNLATGRSILTAGTATPTGSGAEGKPGRVKALFVPGEKKPAKAE